MAIPVKLPVFEGPLDLLLHLIEKNKIDIYDIPIAGITDQYLEYVRQMDHEDLDVTSEFLVMAATLLDIKSRMLLPREKDDETGEEEGDPREELVRRLLEYKMYKYLSEELAVYREQAGVRYFRAQKLPREVLDYRPPINYDELLKDTDLQSLQKIFGEVLRRKKSRRDPIRGGFGKIRREEISLDNKTLYIRAYLQAHPRTDFRALLESRESREEVIVTFLILLELMKTQKVHIVQDSIGGKILVEAGAPEDAVAGPEDAPVSMDTPEDSSDVAEDDSASLDTQEDNDDVAEDDSTSMDIPEDSSDGSEALSPAAFESFESLETFEGAGSELRDAAEAHPRFILPGFYGADRLGRVHTLPRNGSDITGAVAAAALGAEIYENWTDVPGLMTADPSLVPEGFQGLVDVGESDDLGGRRRIRSFHDFSRTPSSEEIVSMLSSSMSSGEDVMALMDTAGSLVEIYKKAFPTMPMAIEILTGFDCIRLCN